MKHLLGLAFLCVSGIAAADTLTIVKWLSMTTYIDSFQNQTITNYPNTPPTGWNISVANNIGQLNCTSSTSKKRNQSGLTSLYRFGSATFEAKVETTKIPSSYCALNVLYTGGSSATATASWADCFSSGAGTLVHPKLKTREVFTALPVQEDSVTLGPGSEKLTLKYNNVNWTTNNGVSEATFAVKASSMSSKAASYSPGGGSNMLATSGNGSVEGKIQIGGITMSPDNFHAGFITGSANIFQDLIRIEIRNEYNALMDVWWSRDSVGYFTFPMELPDGNYRLYFTADTSLRKRVDVTYVASTGVQGVNVTLQYGDLDGNNHVSQLEVDTVYANIGKVNTQKAFFDMIRGKNYGVEDCDINLDGEITMVDYLIALANLNAIGD